MERLEACREAMSAMVYGGLQRKASINKEWVHLIRIEQKLEAELVPFAPCRVAVGSSYASYEDKPCACRRFDEGRRHVLAHVGS